MATKGLIGDGYGQVDAIARYHAMRQTPRVARQLDEGRPPLPNPKPGTYTITYRAVDNANNKAEVTREVEITTTEKLEAKLAEPMVLDGYSPHTRAEAISKQVIARESGTDAETAAWLAAEYERPATVEEIAAAVGNDEALAAETYLAARLVCADLSRKEIVFLSRLSQALKLDDQLVENLEKQLDLA